MYIEQSSCTKLKATLTVNVLARFGLFYLTCTYQSGTAIEKNFVSCDNKLTKQNKLQQNE